MSPDANRALQAPAAATPAAAGHPDPVPLDGPRVRLRRLGPQDLRAFQAYRHDPDVGRWQSWQPLPDAEAAAFLQQMAGAPLATPGQWVQLALARRDDDALIGDIGLCLAPTGDAVDIGYTLARAAQGQGLAREAVRLATQLIFGTGFAARPVARIKACTDVDNAASVRLLQRLGFARYSTLAAVFRGQPCRESHFVLHRPGRSPARLRPATAADAAGVADVLAASRRELMPYAPSAHGDAGVRAWVAGNLIPGGGVTVAGVDGRVAGVLAIARRGGAGWIDQLCVHPDHVAAGIGKALLAHALAALPRPLRLFTFQANLHARGFYEHHGFVAEQFSDGAGNEEHTPDVLYERNAP